MSEMPGTAKIIICFFGKSDLRYSGTDNITGDYNSSCRLHVPSQQYEAAEGVKLTRVQLIHSSKKSIFC